MIPPFPTPAWLQNVAHSPTWTGWRTMQRLAAGTGWWTP